MLRRELAAAAALALISPGAVAQDTVKIGLILPMTGQQSSTGKQIDAAVKLYMAQHGNTVAGKKIEVILKDDTSVPDVTKRLAQELVINDKVAFLAGFGITPSAMATAPIATQAKVPEIVMAAGTSSITEASPFVVRTTFTLAQSSVPMAEWAYKNGIKKVVTLVSDYGPGIDAEKSFSDKFKADGGTIVENLRIPMRSPDFAPVLQKVADAKPDALFVFVPSGTGAQFVKQFVERGLDKSGVKLIATGDVTDDDQLNGMGEVVVGVINAHNYSANHNSALNKAYVDAFKKANGGIRPNFMSVGGYDGMAPDLRGAEEDQRRHRRRQADGGDQGHGLGESARPDLDRSRHARHRAEHLHPQGREGRRRALQRRVRHHRQRQGSGEGGEEELKRASVAYFLSP